jgi:hypothetical protein
LSSCVQLIISWLVAEDGIRGPRIWPEAPTEAAARIVEAARAPWRNLLREIRGFLMGTDDAGGAAVGGVDGVEVGGVEVVDAIGFLSSMNISSVAQE